MGEYVSQNVTVTNKQDDWLTAQIKYNPQLKKSGLIQEALNLLIRSRQMERAKNIFSGILGVSLGFPLFAFGVMYYSLMPDLILLWVVVIISGVSLMITSGMQLIQELNEAKKCR